MRPSVRRASPQEWTEAVAASPSATFFQTPAWHGAMSSTLPGARLAVFRLSWPGASAVWPLWVAGPRLLGRRRRSVWANAAGVYGGWISGTPLPEGAAASAVAWLSGRGEGLAWRPNPYDPSQAAAPAPPRCRRNEDSTVVLDLDGDDLPAGFSHGHRYNIRASRERGVRCRQARSTEDWTAYFRLYASSLSRWGKRATSAYPDALLAGFAAVEGAHLWLAEQDGEPAAGALVFSHGRHAVNWHAAADARFFGSYPANALQAAIIEWAKGTGHARYDFNPSGGHDGVERFKLGFGGRRLASPWFQRLPGGSHA